MATPELTPEQRAQALVKATAVRSARRVFKESLSRGEFTLADAIARAKADDIGPKRAAVVMDEIGISSARRIRGLGAHQVDALLARERR